jgi:hypothetical protein
MIIHKAKNRGKRRKGIEMECTIGGVVGEELRGGGGRREVASKRQTREKENKLDESTVVAV